jgi:hypothetical protein
VTIFINLTNQPGVPVVTLPYGFTFTPTPLLTPPPIQVQETVKRKSVHVGTGMDGYELIKPAASVLVGGSASSIALTKLPYLGFDQGLNECAPAAVSDSLDYLNRVWSLNISPSIITAESLKGPMGFNPDRGCPFPSWVIGKNDYLRSRNIPIDTIVSTDPDQAMQAIRDCCAVELVMEGHAAAVTGMIDLGGGRYSIYLSDDFDQTRPGDYGIYPVLLDEASGVLNGTIWARRVAAGYPLPRFLAFVIECPQRN